MLTATIIPTDFTTVASSSFSAMHQTMSRSTMPNTLRQTESCELSTGILDISSGECTILPLANAMRRNECRIEAIRDSRMLVSCDGEELSEYEIAK